MKITITSKQTEIEGTIEEAEVKIFGTSSHVILSKKHSGKVVNIVIPNKPKYIWILSDEDLNKTIEICMNITRNNNSKLEKVKLQHIVNIRNKQFDYDDLIKVYDMLKTTTNPQHQELIDKIKEAYNLH